MIRTVTLPVKRPSMVLLGAEPWRAAYEYFSHRLARKPPPATGDGHPVIIFPGLGTDGRAVAPLRHTCESLGYTAYDWGLGYNTGPQGDVDTWLCSLAAHCEAMLDGHRQPATLIGWSLGGIYARELAKLRPGRVRQVITIGTPFNSDADYSNVGWLYRCLNKNASAVDSDLSRRLKAPPPVPTTSIFSRSDGIVAWQSCLHTRQRANVQDIEIRGSHMGMGWNAEVLRVVADRLLQKPDRWEAYKGFESATSKKPAVPDVQWTIT